MNKLALSTLLIAIAAAPSVSATNTHRENVRWAKVIDVQPIMRIIEQRTPQQECWNEQVPYRKERVNKRNSHTGAILGTIIGGAIGHNISHHKNAGTIFGAVIGASVGQGLTNQGHSRRDSRVYYENQRRCQTSQHVNYQEKLLGYDVWYIYQGNEYKTQMDHHPGKKIRIRLSVEPY